MASGSKEQSVFTGNSIGGSPGETSSIEETRAKGMTINRAFPMDNIHGVDLPNTRGKELKGSVNNLAHSLTGASAVQRQTGKVKGGI